MFESCLSFSKTQFSAERQEIQSYVPTHLDYCTDCKGNYLARTDALRTGSSIAPKSRNPESLWSKHVLQQLGIKVMTCFWEFLCRIFPSLRNSMQGLQDKSIWKLLSGEIMSPERTRQFVLLDAFSQSMLQSSKRKARSPWMASPPAQGHL